MRQEIILTFFVTFIFAGFGGYVLSVVMFQRMDVAEHTSLDSRNWNIASTSTTTQHHFNKFRRTNFPKRPLKPKDVNFCDTTGGVLRLRYSWTCPGDPTCLSCYDDPQWHQLVKNKPDIDALNIGEGGKPVPRSLVISGVNWGQMYLVSNWLCSCKAAGVPDPRNYTVMVPTDRTSYDYLRGTLGFKLVIDPKWVEDVHIDSTYNGGANVRGHSAINNAILVIALALMEKFPSNVLVHDVDQAWINGGPIEYLENVASTGMVDMLGMESPYDTAKGGFNTGFLYFVNNEYSRIFMETLVNLGRIKDTSDQALINSLIRFRRFTHSYMVAPLPTELFVREGGSRGPRVNPAHSLVYHAVSIKKKEKLTLNGQWFFNSTRCPNYYDEKLKVVTQTKYI
jgi:hypothetical protein